MKTPDEALISALLTSPTNAAAAQKCGLSVKQLYNRMASPEFKAKLSEARWELLDRAVNALETRLSDAVQTMGEICTDTKTPAQVRLNASCAILRNALRMSERADIADRLAELERIVDTLEAGR